MSEYELGEERYASVVYDFIGNLEQKTMTVFKGDIVKIKAITESQWWLAEMNGNAGFIPKTYVILKDKSFKPYRPSASTITKNTPAASAEIQKKASKISEKDEDDELKEIKDEDLTDDEDEDESPIKQEAWVNAIALYSFDKAHPRQVSMKKKDKILVLDPKGEKLDWLEADVGGQKGLVPANRVYILQPGEVEPPQWTEKKRTTTSASVSIDSAIPLNEKAPDMPEEEKIFAVALQSFSNNAGFSFNYGELIQVFPTAKNDWEAVTRAGKKGTISATMVRVVNESEAVVNRRKVLMGNTPLKHLTVIRKPMRSVPVFAALFQFKVFTLQEVQSGSRTVAPSMNEDDVSQPSASASRGTIIRTKALSVYHKTRGRGASKVDAPSPDKAKKGTPATPQAKKVSEDEVAVVEKNVRFMHVADGTELFAERTKGNATLYVVLEGEVELSTLRHKLGLVKAGFHFGEEMLEDEEATHPYTAVFRAKTPGGYGWLLCLSLVNHSKLCKKLNWYDDAMSSVVKLRSEEYLSSIPILSTLDLSLLRKKMFIKVLVKGQSPSTKEDDESAAPANFNWFSIVIAGSLSVSVGLADGTRKELRKLNMGSTFNEKFLSPTPVVPPSPASAPEHTKYTALDNCLLLCVRSEDVALVSALDSRLSTELVRLSRFRSAETVANVPFIESIPPAKREDFLNSFDFALFRTNEEVTGLNRNLFVVCEGKVEVLDERGDAIKVAKALGYFGERSLSALIKISSAGPSSAETGLVRENTICLVLPIENLERFLDSAPEIKGSVKGELIKMFAAVSSSSLSTTSATTSAVEVKRAEKKHSDSEMNHENEEVKFAFQQGANRLALPTSADDLAVLSNVPPEYLKHNVEVQNTLQIWDEIGQMMSPCLKILNGHPQYMHHIPLEVRRKEYFVVSLVKVDDKCDALKLQVLASHTVADVVQQAFERYAQTYGGALLDSAGPNVFGLKVAGRADYLVERTVQLSRYRCVTRALTRSMDRGELKFCLVDLRVDPKLGTGLRKERKNVEPKNKATSLLDAVALYDFDGGANGIRISAGDRLQIEPNAEESNWLAFPAIGGRSGYVPQNVVKALAPVVGPVRALNHLVPKAPAPKQMAGVPEVGTDQFAKLVQECTLKTEKIPALLANAEYFPYEMSAPWPLRIRLRGLEKVFFLPEIERCVYLQMRVELVCGGQVLETKFSKKMKRGSVLRFDDDWFYFSKFLSDLNLSTRLTFTLIGLDPSPVEKRDESAFEDEEKPTLRRMESKLEQLSNKPTKADTPMKEGGGGIRAFFKKKNLEPSSSAGENGKKLNETNRDGVGMNAPASSQLDVSPPLDLAGVAIQVFNSDLLVKRGMLAFSLWPGVAGERVLLCTENFDPDSSMLFVEFDSFHEPYMYDMPPPAQIEVDVEKTRKVVKSVAQERKKKESSAGRKEKDVGGASSQSLAKRRQSVSVFQKAKTERGFSLSVLGPSKPVQALLARDPLQLYKMTDIEKSLIWSERELLVDNSYALSKVMLSVNWMNAKQRNEAITLLSTWSVPTPMQALELLDGRFGEFRLREYGVKCLESFDDEELADFLLQLVQGLKYECFHDSPLARFLLRRALSNPRVIGTKLFWGLRAEMHDKRFSLRFGLILKAYLKSCGSHFTELCQHHDVQEMLKSVALQAQKLKNASKVERTNFARLGITSINDRLGKTFQLAIDPRMKAIRFNPDGCRIMSSKKRPLWLEMDCVDPVEAGGEKMLVMFKCGDDLRQDQMTLQILRILEQIWLAEDINLKLTPYGCISTGDELGLLEIVPDTQTIAMIETSYGGTFGSLSATPIRKYLEKHNGGQSVETAIDNFVRSCAGYCVATYIMGIGDRHNDNIMVAKDGRLLHIDFGHFLGNFKVVKALGNFKRERTPFVFTKGMAFVMGGKGTEEYKRFVEFCCTAFNIIRLHADELVTVFRLMVPAGMPELRSDEDIGYLVDQLHLDKSNEEASSIFQSEINAAIADVYRLIDNLLHTLKHS